jgi:PAS domain S-box-containing protein
MNPILLLVDDEPSISDAIESSLIDEHYTIYKAGCAAEALSVLEHHSITVIISDQSMPGMSGLELCSIVRERWPTTYRMLFLGSEQDKQFINDSAAAVHHGDIHQILEKPWDAMLLRYNINEGIRQQRILQQALTLRSSFQQSDQACFITDNNWVVLLASPSAADWLGLEQNDLAGKNLFSPCISNNTIEDETHIIQAIETQAHWQGSFHFNTHSVHGDESLMCIVPFLEHHYLCIAIPMIDDMLHKLSNHSLPQRENTEVAPIDSSQIKESHHYLKFTFDHPKANNLDFISVISERLQFASDNLYPTISTAEGIHFLHLPISLKQCYIDNLLANIHQVFIEPFSFHGQAAQLKWKAERVNSQHIHSISQPAIEHERINSSLAKTSQDARYQGHSYFQPQKYSNTGFSCLPIFDQNGQTIALMPPPCTHREEVELWLQDALYCSQEWQNYAKTSINWLNDLSGLKPHHVLRAVAAIISLQRKTGQENNPWWLILSNQQIHDLYHDHDNILQQLNNIKIKILVSDPDYHLNSIKEINHHLSHSFAGICMSKQWLFDNQKQLKRHSIQLLNHLKKQPLLFLATGVQTAEQLALLHQSPCHWLAGDILSAKLLPQQVSWLHQ